MDFKVYDYLPESAKFVRQTVFVDEQGFVNELDETDNIATHRHVSRLQLYADPRRFQRTAPFIHLRQIIAHNRKKACGSL